MLNSIKQRWNGKEPKLKVVPESVDEITSDWCENIFRNESMISTDTFIPSITIKSLTNDITGLEDGGGLSGSALVRVIPKYSGKVTGKEPSSFICKLSLGTGWNLSFKWNFILYCSAGGPYDEYMYRQEANFLTHVLPIMKNSLYKFPEVYHCRTNEKSDRGFATAVILNKPTKLFDKF